MEGDRLAVPLGMGERVERSSISSAGPRTQDVLVYLVDDTVVRLTVDNLPSATAHELHRILLATLRLPESALEIFSLWLASPFLGESARPSPKCPRARTGFFAAVPCRQRPRSATEPLPGAWRALGAPAMPRQRGHRSHQPRPKGHASRPFFRLHNNSEREGQHEHVLSSVAVSRGLSQSSGHGGSVSTPQSVASKVQLKPKHQPYKVCRQWQELLFRFTSCSSDEILEDEPSLQFRRNIFFSKRKEMQVSRCGNRCGGFVVSSEVREFVAQSTEPQPLEKPRNIRRRSQQAAPAHASLKRPCEPGLCHTAARAKGFGAQRRWNCHSTAPRTRHKWVQHGGLPGRLPSALSRHGPFCESCSVAVKGAHASDLSPAGLLGPASLTGCAQETFFLEAGEDYGRKRFLFRSSGYPFPDPDAVCFVCPSFLPSRRPKIQDEDILRLLYEEAKFNILEGRYPFDLVDCEALGALVCRVNLGPYDPNLHTAFFLKERLDSFLPAHLCRRGHGLLAALWRRGGARPPADEQGLLRAFRGVPEEGACEAPLPLPKLYRAYLQKCHELPYYGCAFFSGEIEKPAQGLLHRGGRKAVMVAISLEGVYIIDSKEKHVLLGLRFQELSWDHTFPSEEEHILWLEFDGENEGIPVNKLLKVYSKQVGASHPSHVLCRVQLPVWLGVFTYLCQRVCLPQSSAQKEPLEQKVTSF
ncbi:FERM domain-containing protein 8 [Varanus komodoensis]|nr:FERM domain-containing protein 8 [Varanus komodoensis]